MAQAKKIPTKADLIARRVRFGGNEAESAALLEELINDFSVKNLPKALHYWGFATPLMAERFAATLEA